MKKLAKKEYFHTLTPLQAFYSLSSLRWRHVSGLVATILGTTKYFSPRRGYWSEKLHFCPALMRVRSYLEVLIWGLSKHVYLHRAVQTRVGHAYAEYAVHADYTHMRGNARICRCGWKSHPHYPHRNICQKWQFFGPKMGQPGSVFNSECPKYHYCSSHLVLSILRNEK